eukprot:6289243-Ditylum_brightwellii.AAC.1
MESICIIQRAWRYALAGRKMWSIISLCYQKFVNTELDTTGQPFWHSTKTGKSIWAKPSFFGQSDLARVIPMPKKDRLLQIMCDFCGKVSAKWHDVQD